MQLAEIKETINRELADKETFNSLLLTTFKGLEASLVKRAIMEGMVRGFDFKDFLEKNVYAIPYRTGYSLVTSIDYARKIGFRSGIVGKSAPKYVENDGKVVSCEVTVKRAVNGNIGDYTALVYFDEYYKPGYNGKPSLWDSKPRTMIAKVAEMHALRMACPEQLAQSYVEEEFQKPEATALPFDVAPHRERLEKVATTDELKAVWSALPIEAKKELEGLKDELKATLATSNTEDEKV